MFHSLIAGDINATYTLHTKTLGLESRLHDYTITRLYNFKITRRKMGASKTTKLVCSKERHRREVASDKERKCATPVQNARSSMMAADLQQMTPDVVLTAYDRGIRSHARSHTH